MFRVICEKDAVLIQRIRSEMTFRSRGRSAMGLEASIGVFYISAIDGMDV